MSTVAVRPDESLLEKSRQYCRDLTRREAKNFYYGLKLLPEPKRSAMYALYAYMRLIDDIADAEDGRTYAQRVRDLDAWAQQTHAVLGGAAGAQRRHILWPAFAELVQRYHVPEQVIDEMIAGQRQDLEPVAIETFEALERYCYRVASVVGLASIWVFGFSGGEVVEKLAIDRGIALQLTNILRDLREDAGRERCYLPQDELKRFGVTAEDVAWGKGGAGFRALMAFQITRAQGYYERSAALEQHIEEDSRPTLRAMTAIYHGILERIQAEPERVLRERISLSLWAKLNIGWRALRGK